MSTSTEIDRVIEGFYCIYSIRKATWNGAIVLKEVIVFPGTVFPSKVQ